MQNLRRDRDLKRQAIHSIGNPVSLRVTSQVEQIAAERPTVDGKRQCLAVLRCYPVALVVERHGAADKRRLLARHRPVGSASALTLKAYSPVVERAAQPHPA